MNNAQAQKPPTDPNRYEKAIFAAGCFWHVQYEFDQIPGVISTTVGYTGGTTVNPTYKQVCTGKTGHAEALEIIYDPGKVSYEKLLDVFFENHDPTTLNRQGPDPEKSERFPGLSPGNSRGISQGVGLQYRSAIFYHNEGQRQAALAVIDKLTKSGRFARAIVTEVKSAGPFYKAEDYHQKYLKKHGDSFCPSL